jgi:hypothetical protein
MVQHLHEKASEVSDSPGRQSFFELGVDEALHVAWLQVREPLTNQRRLMWISYSDV